MLWNELSGLTLLSSFNSPVLHLLHFLHGWHSGMLIEMMFFYSIFLDLELTLTSAFPLISDYLMGLVHLGEFHLKYGIFVKLIHLDANRGLYS